MGRRAKYFTLAEWTEARHTQTVQNALTEQYVHLSTCNFML
jgi:hypothetical protein